MGMISTIACGRTCKCNYAGAHEAEILEAADNRQRCPILREFGHAKSGVIAMTREERWAEYLGELRTAAARESVDVPHKLFQAGVPADALNCLGRLEENKALSAAKRFAIAPREQIRTLLLFGKNGIGKSVAAAWVLSDSAKRHTWNSEASGGKSFEPFRWMHASEVTSETDFGRVDDNFLEGLRRARVLVVDDLGKDSTVPGFGAMRDLLTYRHEKKLGTVITSNFTPKEFGEVYGRSLVQRLQVAAILADLAGEETKRKRQR